MHNADYEYKDLPIRVGGASGNRFLIYGPGTTVVYYSVRILDELIEELINFKGKSNDQANNQV